ncbi:MAG: hypothetical protein LBI12_00755, partial [Treponema sp.]|nr:hypothetical protein [Treponema sp.]
MTDKKNKIRTPYSIFFVYVFFMGALIMIFRFIFPGAEVPLSIYSRDWKLIQGLLEFFKFFPALAFSALIIPFGFVAEEENLPSFSDIFFKRLLVSVITAICAAVIYGIIFFLAMPVAKSSEENMRYKGEVFKLAKKHALDRRDAGEWQEAAQFLAVCDVIWLNSPELTSLKAEVDINVQRIKAQESREVSQVRASFDRDWRSAELTALSGGQQPVNSTQAIAMGTTAFNEKRYFDAHWLATLGTRLAISGSPEAANAARLASEAWNMIAAQRPNQREEHFYEIY